MRWYTVSLMHPDVISGGAQRAAHDLAAVAAEDEAVEARLLSIHDSDAEPSVQRVGASVNFLSESPADRLLLARGFDHFSLTSFDTRMQKGLLANLRAFRPEVVHLHHPMILGVNTIQAIRQALPEAAILLTLHEYMAICNAGGQLRRLKTGQICRNFAPSQCPKCFPEKAADDFLVRKSYLQAMLAGVDRFVAPSDYVRDQYVAWGLDPARVEMIPNGYPPGSEAPLRPPSADVNRFGFFGQYVDAKGIDVLIEAASLFAQGSDTPIRVDIFGGNKRFASDAYTERIRGLIEALPSSVRVVEHGNYERYEVLDLMAEVDWVVVPSVWPETFGLVLSEAKIAGRPAIVSDVGGLGPRVRHEVDGFRVPPGSAQRLSEVIGKVVGNRALWDTMSRECRPDLTPQEVWERHKTLAAEALRDRRMAA